MTMKERESSENKRIKS